MRTRARLVVLLVAAASAAALVGCSAPMPPPTSGSGSGGGPAATEPVSVTASAAASGRWNGEWTMLAARDVRGGLIPLATGTRLDVDGRDLHASFEGCAPYRLAALGDDARIDEWGDDPTITTQCAFDIASEPGRDWAMAAFGRGDLRLAATVDATGVEHLIATGVLDPTLTSEGSASGMRNSEVRGPFAFDFVRTPDVRILCPAPCTYADADAASVLDHGALVLDGAWTGTLGWPRSDASSLTLQIDGLDGVVRTWCPKFEFTLGNGGMPLAAGPTETPGIECLAPPDRRVVQQTADQIAMLADASRGYLLEGRLVIDGFAFDRGPGYDDRNVPIPEDPTQPDR